MNLVLSFSSPDSEKTFLNSSGFNSNIGWAFSDIKLKVMDFFGLTYSYKQLIRPKNDLSSTKVSDKFMIHDYTEECRDIMKHDVAIVNVQFATNRYTKTILDKRFSFADRLSSFGKKCTTGRK